MVLHSSLAYPLLLLNNTHILYMLGLSVLKYADLPQSHLVDS